MPNNQYEVDQVARHALNAINASNLTDAEVAPLTTVASLVALFTGRATGEWTQRRDMEFHHASMGAAQAMGLFTDANVAAANTVAGLRTVLTTAASALATGSLRQTGNRAWQ